LLLQGAALGVFLALDFFHWFLLLLSRCALLLLNN
jgi:hypothetical protein